MSFSCSLRVGVRDITLRDHLVCTFAVGYHHGELDLSRYGVAAGQAGIVTEVTASGRVRATAGYAARHVTYSQI
jgi:hypothetical protein